MVLFYLQKGYTTDGNFGLVFSRGCYADFPQFRNPKKCDDNTDQSLPRVGLKLRIHCCNGNNCNGGGYAAPSVLLMLTAAMVAILKN